MERNVTTLGTVIQTRRYGEMHRKISVLTPEMGILDVTVYGARKGKALGKADLFLTGKFYLYHNPVRGDYTLQDVEILAPHEPLRGDYDLMWAASFCCELAQRTHGGDSTVLFMLLEQALDLLATGSDPDRTIIQFVWKLLSNAGNAPDLEQCPVCDRPYEQSETLSFELSMLVPCCSDCSNGYDEMNLPPGARRYLAVTQELELVDAVAVPLSAVATGRIRSYMLRYASLFAGGGLKTLASQVPYRVSSQE